MLRNNCLDNLDHSYNIHKAKKIMGDEYHCDHVLQLF